MLPVLQSSLSARVCSRWLSERTVGIPHFLSCLERTLKYTQTKTRRGCCPLRVWFSFKCHVCSSEEDAAFLRPVSRVSLAVLPSSAPSSSLIPLKIGTSPAGGKLSLHHCPHPYKLHTSQASLFFFSAISLSLAESESVSLSVLRSRPSISQESILSPFPNRISLPCCQTGFSEVPVTASCFKSQSLGRYCKAHTKPSGYSQDAG